MTLKTCENKVIHVGYAYGWPTKDTFDCPPIGTFVRKYLTKSKISVDPFARNKRWATYTNDLNPKTKAEYHMDAYDFLVMLKEKEVKADLIIFDPPYSLEQLKRSYEDVGRYYTLEDGWKPNRWSQEKDVCVELLIDGGFFLQFGWTSWGMSRRRGFEPIEVLLVCHFADHHDTICPAERKTQRRLVP